MHSDLLSQQKFSALSPASGGGPARRVRNCRCARRAGPPSPPSRSLEGPRPVTAVFETPGPDPAPSPGLPLPDSARSSAVGAASSPRLAESSFQRRGGNPESTLLGTRSSFWDAKRTHRPFPSARGAALDTAGTVQVWSPLIGVHDGLRAALGTPRPGCALACAWPPCGRLGGAFLTGHGVRTHLCVSRVQA